MREESEEIGRHVPQSYSCMAEVSDKQKELEKAITGVANLPQSIPDDAIDAPRFGATTHYCSGSTNRVYGNQYNNTGSGHTYHAKSKSFGTDGKKNPICQVIVPERSENKPIRGQFRRIEFPELFANWVKSSTMSSLGLYRVIFPLCSFVYCDL